jgi:hypothetical protein
VGIEANSIKATITHFRSIATIRTSPFKRRCDSGYTRHQIHSNSTVNIADRSI